LVLAERIRHLKLGEDGWTGPLFVDKSSDRRRTWRLAGRTVKTAASQAAGFKKISAETAMWRVRERANGGTVVERRAGENSGWKAVHTFPGDMCRQ